MVKIPLLGEAHSLDRMKPEDIVPLIFTVSKRNVKSAMHDRWIGKVPLDDNFTMAHGTQFVELWAELREVQLNANMEGGIV